MKRRLKSGPRPLSVYSLYRRLFAVYGPQGWWPAESPFEVIVGAILAQNTAWTNVKKALLNLKKTGLLRLEPLRQTDLPRLKKLIKPAGFFNQKARCIRALIRTLDRRHKGNLNAFLRKKNGVETRKALLDIRGIGPETADSILLYAAKHPFFVVDAYARRIFVRLGILPQAPLSYNAVQVFFEKRLMRDAARYQEYHALIVRHAKMHCRKTPLCRNCPLERSCQKRI